MSALARPLERSVDRRHRSGNMVQQGTRDMDIVRRSAIIAMPLAFEVEGPKCIMYLR